MCGNRQLRQNLRFGEQVSESPLCFVDIALIICVLLFRSIVDELKPAYEIADEARQPECVSIAWSSDGQTLFAGFTDNALRVWTVTS